MKKIILNAEMRDETGKTKVKELRRKAVIPACLYKKGEKSINIKMNKKDLDEVLHTSAGENVLLTLKIKDDKKKERVSIIKELQHDILKDDIIHADFNEISLTEKIKVKVPVHPLGEPEGVVKDGGVLDNPLREVEVECLPADIPEKIDVEVAPMKIGDAVYVKDLKVPSGVMISTDPSLTVLSVVPPAKEEVVEAAPAAEGVEEPEVIGKGKKEKPEEEAEVGQEKTEKPKPEAKKEAPKKE